MSEIIEKKIFLPLTDEIIKSLSIGDRVLLNGVIYTARDEAHEILVKMIDNKETLPVDLHNQIIYYVGPCPCREGEVIGSCGPTTSGRMDKYTEKLLKETGLKGMIGKGKRSKDVVLALKKYTAVYFAAIGGIGALLADCVKEAEVIAFPELGPEAIYKLKVENFPVTVINDCEANDLYDEAISKYKQS